ncbi:hypothetical protein J5N97_010175 [Dioscorea zingiberensis]|uniref:Uncharacterized protein n=1 Tax=Dioscorea zingiberensis TaxID=325984 RepID=A0A9D5CXX8_9LILI|nr:hypothetical protein J5N97_010175 [Dioscorea zingiberensis]
MLPTFASCRCVESTVKLKPTIRRKAEIKREAAVKVLVQLGCKVKCRNVLIVMLKRIIGEIIFQEMPLRCSLTKLLLVWMNSATTTVKNGNCRNLLQKMKRRNDAMMKINYDCKSC